MGSCASVYNDNELFLVLVEIVARNKTLLVLLNVAYINAEKYYAGSDRVGSIDCIWRDPTKLPTMLV